VDNPEYEYFLLDIADKVENLAVSENRKRFEQHSCNFGKKQAAYSRARKWAEVQWKIALAKSLPEQTSYLKRKGWEQVKVKDRSTPVNVYSSAKNHWKPPKTPLDPFSRFLSVLTDEPPQLKIDEALAYYYFSLATIHDKMREGYILIHNETYAKQLAKSVWPIIENLCVDRQFIIKAAFKHVKIDLAEKAEKPAVTGQKTKRQNRRSKKPEKKFQPWKKSGDACFIIEGNRIKFYYRQEFKDLRLRNETNPHKLLFLFAAKNPLPQVEIKDICTKGTRPSDIAKQTNMKLNEKIAAMALSDVPKDIEFVKYDDKSKCYGLWPEIKHKDDVDYE